MVGSAICRSLTRSGFTNVTGKASSALDLRDQRAVRTFFESMTPEYVFLAAAKVGGILANRDYKAEFIYDNLMIEANVIRAAHEAGVKKLLFLGSSCIYPKNAPQPISESSLLAGHLEPTNDAYAVAKIAGIKLCQAFHEQYGDNFISVMPSNLYGYGDNYHPQHSHVLPALLRRFHEARQAGLPAVTIWGSGTPRREFMFADDLADACVFLMQHYNEPDIVNVGTGSDVSIQELAVMIAGVVGYQGEIRNDLSKPDGTAVKLLDVAKIHGLGWRHRIELANGIPLAYRDFLDHESAFSKAG